MTNTLFNTNTLRFPELSPALVAWGAFGLIVVVFVIVSIVLLYHWQRYRVTSAVPRTIVVGYFTIAAIPIIIMLVSLVAWS
jgi:hypothetical protein